MKSDKGVTQRAILLGGEEGVVFLKISLPSPSQKAKKGGGGEKKRSKNLLKEELPDLPKYLFASNIVRAVLFNFTQNLIWIQPN